MKRATRPRFTWEMAVRVIADASMVNAALLIALVVRFLWLINVQGGVVSARTAYHDYVQIYLNTFWILTPVSLVVFSLSGFYTHGRIYRGRYKALVIAQAISLSYLVFGFLVLLLWHMTSFPRSALFLAWFLTLVFLIGAVFGSIAFNELFPLIKPIYTWGQSSQESFGVPGLAFVHTSMNISKSAFAFLFAIVAIGCFWGSEALEKRFAEKRAGHGRISSPFLKAFTIALIVTTGSLFLLPTPQDSKTAQAKTTDRPVSRHSTLTSETSLLAAVASAEDHVEPEELAEDLSTGVAGVIAVDIRPEIEFYRFHIRGAVNVQMPDLPAFAAHRRAARRIVLYSNGMTHPAQARDALVRLGYSNIYILTDGLNGFMDRCLKPISLRREPLPETAANKIAFWRAFFLAQNDPASKTSSGRTPAPIPMPGMIPVSWLAENRTHPSVKIIDCRDQSDYNRGHIPGSYAVSYESFRGVVSGIPSLLLPSGLLAQKLSLFGIKADDIVVIVYAGDRLRDATLIGMVFERLGHHQYGILEGGFDKWTSEKREVDAGLPSASTSIYPIKSETDMFTFTGDHVYAFFKQKTGVILDVRPMDYYIGKKSDEARAGHIPEALNRPFNEDLAKTDASSTFKPLAELEAAYAKLIPSKETEVVVHCRTGHQASQTFFVLKHLLGYKKVFWYDAGWTEWAARSDFPVKEGRKP